MDIKTDLVRIIRRTQTVISIILFFIVLGFCWAVTDLDVKKIQLSHWGGNDMEYGWLWNSIIVLLSVSIFFNNILFVKNHTRIKRKNVPYILFSFVAICLFFVGAFNLDYGLLHDIPAWLYFFTYPLSIFVMTYLNRKTLLYQEWFKHLIFSITMIILPLVFITAFDGLAVPEIIHTTIVCFWNINTAFKRFDINI
jgi:hypothetical membrane protein